MSNDIDDVCHSQATPVSKIRMIESPEQQRGKLDLVVLHCQRVQGKHWQKALHLFGRFCGLNSWSLLQALARSSLLRGNTMRVEILPYMIYSEGPEYPAYVVYFFSLKVFWNPQYRSMLVNSSKLVLLNKQQKNPKIFGASTIKEYGVHFLQRVFPGMFQVIMSNTTVFHFHRLPLSPRRPTSRG